MKTESAIWRWTVILVLAISQFSCEKKEEHRHEQGETRETQAHHEHTAPHGGTLVVFGNEFAHIELVLDQTTGKLTAYVLDGEAEKSVQTLTENN